MRIMLSVSHLQKVLREKFLWQLDLYQVDDQVVIEKDGEFLCEVDIPDPLWFSLTPNVDIQFIEIIRQKIDTHLTTKLLKEKADGDDSNGEVG